MFKMRSIGPLIGPLALAAVLSLTTLAEGLVAQGGPSPFRTVDGWAKLPGGREMGAVGDVTIDPDGEHVWAVVRCDAGPERFGNECLDSNLDPVIKFDSDGNVVESFGGGMFIWPHGIDVDPDGNVWVTDAVAAGGTPQGRRGHQVIKFSPEGEVLLVLGTPGVPGGGRSSFNAPADVVVADDGSIFVADGHANETNNRVVKFAPDGSYLMEWGQTGYAPGEFRTLHAIALDSRGRVFVADRSNNRIQIFDQDGTLLDSWTQFGRPSGLFIDQHDTLYVADSESRDNEGGYGHNPNVRRGIRIGSAVDGTVTRFIPDPAERGGSSAAEGVAVDHDGNVYGAEISPGDVKKYIPR